MRAEAKGLLLGPLRRPRKILPRPHQASPQSPHEHHLLAWILSSVDSVFLATAPSTPPQCFQFQQLETKSSEVGKRGTDAQRGAQEGLVALRC